MGNSIVNGTLSVNTTHTPSGSLSVNYGDGATMTGSIDTAGHGYGDVTEIGGGSKRFPHAWIEDKGRVFDWQTHEHKLYSHSDNIITKNKWDKKGYPIKDYYKLFNVKKPKKYTPTEVADNFRKYKSIMGWDWK